MVSFGLVFLTLTLSIGANLEDGFLARLGLDPNILLATLVALVITGLVAHQRLALVVLVVLMTVAANLPAELALSIGYDPDYVLAGLVAVVTTPWIRRIVF